MPKLHPRTGLPAREEREHWPVGLVTPYGRWLQHPDAGAHGAFASGNCINLVYPPERPGQAERRHPGRQRTVAGSLRTRAIRSLGADTAPDQVASGRRQRCAAAPARSGGAAQRPEGDRAHDDGLIRARRSDDIMLLLDATGQPLFDSTSATC
jgi:hypothetical protein